MDQRQHFKFNCYNCGKAGHKRSNCWKINNGGSRRGYNANRADQDQEQEDGVAFLTSACMMTSGEAALRTVIWYLDSGATDHMVKVANYLKESRKLGKPLKINIAKNRVVVFATEIGNIELCRFNVEI